MLSQREKFPPTHKNAGQIREIRDAAQKSRRFDYNDRGQQTHAWGAAQYPTKTTHTAYGETQTLTTYRGGSGWDGTTWPTGSEGTGDLTTWQHFAPTGLLEFKQDAQGRKTSYTYRDNGQIHLRTWQRGVTATHSYDGSGLLTGIAYSDTTPPVAITRHRTGEAKTLTDAAGLHTYAYTPAGRVDLETITGTGPHAGITLDHTYAPNGIAGNLTVTAGAATIYGTSRTFHPASGLLDEVASGNTQATYRHHPGSAFVHQITHKHNGEAALVNSRRYDDLNRLTATTHFATGDLDAEIPMTPLAYTGYQHDALHRRTRATELDGSYWQYGYNDRSEVREADKKLTDGTPLAGKQYRHTFDNIGNVTSKESGGDATGANRRTFTTPASSLNQYSGYATPATFDILGTAPGTPAVTVNGAAAAYQGDFFRAEVTAANANANGEWKAVTVTSGATTQSGHRYIAPASFTPTYDLDGNLTDDGEWSYAWDAENRLKTITRTTRAQTAGAPYRRIEYTYDAQHRCAERKEYHVSAGPVVKTERYLYDGWNRVATLNATNQPQQRYTWGTDLSGGLQGAGGVGGLLWIEDVPTTTTHLVCMDGNGNVTALINATTEQPTARYEYGPFGDLIRQSGPYAASNPYRFSTKPQDTTTNLLYYGYRWFKADWNTWASRDPIAENGGENLYGYVGNNGLSKIDPLGLKKWEWFSIVSKSYINGIGNLGDLGNRAGAPWRSNKNKSHDDWFEELSRDKNQEALEGLINNLILPESETPQGANARLKYYADLSALSPAFNQNPTTDAKDGQYRLYSKVFMQVCCDKGKIKRKNDGWDKAGGVEGPGFGGTMNLRYRFIDKSDSFQVVWTGWGRPNLLVEGAFQWVAFRNNRSTGLSIWHEGTATVTCEGDSPKYSLDSFIGGKFPSRQVWFNGSSKRTVGQGAFSDLWNEHPTRKGYVK